MFLVDILATYKDMDLISLGKWTSIGDETIIDHFKEVSKEILILRTCNRFEIYIVPRNDPTERIKLLFSEHGQTRILYDMDAVYHIIEVASGMDSMVPGEQDIQRQVKDALKNSLEKKTSGKILNYIFMRALNISKTVRSETKIGNGIVSIPQSAVKILESMLKNGELCIIGTGKVANLLLKYLKGENFIITVFGRNDEKLNYIKEKYDVKVEYLKNIQDNLKKYDAVISAISIKDPFLKKENFDGTKPILVIDLGNPRNIEKLEDRYYVDLEYIKGYVEKNITQRKSEMEKARKIIDEKIIGIEDKINSMEIDYLISNIFKRAERIKKSEIEKSIKILGKDAEFTLEKFGSSMINKIYSNLITNLRKERDHISREEIELIKKLFR